MKITDVLGWQCSEVAGQLPVEESARTTRSWTEVPIAAGLRSGKLVVDDQFHTQGLRVTVPTAGAPDKTINYHYHPSQIPHSILGYSGTAFVRATGLAQPPTNESHVFSPELALATATLKQQLNPSVASLAPIFGQLSRIRPTDTDNVSPAEKRYSYDASAKPIEILTAKIAEFLEKPSHVKKEGVNIYTWGRLKGKPFVVKQSNSTLQHDGIIESTTSLNVESPGTAYHFTLQTPERHEFLGSRIPTFYKDSSQFFAPTRATRNSNGILFATERPLKLVSRMLAAAEGSSTDPNQIPTRSF